MIWALQSLTTMVKSLLHPDMIRSHVDEIPIQELFDRGFRTLVLDVDNTLLTYSQRELSLQMMNWIHEAQSIGFRLVLLSNNSSKRRIARISRQTGLPSAYFSMKPLSFTIREMAADYGFDLERSVFVGDQLLTDVICGNWVKGYTVLVDPIDKGVSFIKTVQREMELFLIRKLFRR